MTSDYPWITIRESDGLRGEDGWTIAECDLCGRNSFDNAPTWTEYWTHEHAEKCHPRYLVRKGDCDYCLRRHNEQRKGLNVWVIHNSYGVQFGCRETFEEAIVYATRKANLFLKGEILSG